MTKDNIYVSNKLKEFIDEIQYHNRNPIDNSVLKMLEDIDTNPERIISPGGKFLYRSRVIHAKDKLQKINCKRSILSLDLMKRVALFRHQIVQEI